MPLSLFLFDVLHLDGTDLIDVPAHERFSRLAAVTPAELVIPRLVTAELAEAEQFFAAAIDRGHEGVVVKSLDAPYGAGRRGSEWIKVKPRHTLDLLVLGAEWGHGRRQGWLSNLHLGARDPATGRAIMLGKTFKGLTDALLAWQTDRLLELADPPLRDADGPRRGVVRVRPELVVEIAFDGVQASTRYPGGVTLRFARVLRYRPDKNRGGCGHHRRGPRPVGRRRTGPQRTRLTGPARAVRSPPLALWLRRERLPDHGRQGRPKGPRGCKRYGSTTEGAWRTTLRGRQVLSSPRINKGTAFSDAERAELGLIGLIPAGHMTLDQQAGRVYAQFLRQSSNLARNVLLNELHDRNEVLYYRVLADHLSEMLPVIYTPTVGQAIENYSHEYRRPRGVYLSVDQPELIEQSLRGVRSRRPTTST